MKKKVVSILLTIVMLFGIIPLGGISVFAAEGEQQPVVFRYYDEAANVFRNSKWTDNYTLVTSGTTAWNTGWYVASGTVTIDSRVSVTGDVKLILTDGCSLTVNGGINVADGQSLTIFAQSEGTGFLNADAGNLTFSSGIGGNRQSCGTVNVYGGSVTANGGAGGAGIGGGYEGAGGTVNVYGGSVTATGGGEGAGIGGGKNDSGGTVNIYGGSVTAGGGDEGAGIGGGYRGAGGTVNVYGGFVRASSGGGWKSPGIGAGRDGIDNGIITVDKDTRVFNTENGTEYVINEGQKWTDIFNGSSVSFIALYQQIPYLAYDNENGEYTEQICKDGKPLLECVTTLNSGYYIAQDEHSFDGDITVNGDVKLILADNSLTEVHGINVSEGNSLTIFAQLTEENMGTLTVQGGDYSAGIGGGWEQNCGAVIIHGGRIEAKGGDYGAGIGGGQEGNGGTVEIYGGFVTATAGKYSASIGIGDEGRSHGTLTVSEKLTVIDNATNEKINTEDIPNCASVSIGGHEYGYTRYRKYENGKFVTEYSEEEIYYPWNGAAWADGWYEVDGTLSLDTVTVKGDVSLILKDDCDLTVTGGITVNEGNSLTIYAQSEGEHKGKLTASGTNNSAGIGSAKDVNAGTITIHGGDITASGDAKGAGIGGGDGGNGGTLTVFGGDIKATGNQSGAGIGGGSGGNGGTVTVFGGKIFAKSYGTSAGIGGGGSGGNGGVITIIGGDVTANGSLNGAGIGGGSNGDGAVVKIQGGTVTANGGYGAQCIGKGNGGSNNGTFETDGDIKVKTAEGDEYISLPSEKSVYDYQYAYIIGNSNRLSITVENGKFAVGTTGENVGTGVINVSMYDNVDTAISELTFDLAKGEEPTGTVSENCSRIKAEWWTDIDTKTPLCKPVEWKIWSSENTLPTVSGTYILDKDVTLESAWVIPSGVAITLDLNGHTLKRNLTEATENGYVISTSGNLTILDSSTGKTGKITGGKNTGNGGGIYVSGGTLTMNDVTLSGNSAINGGGIYLEQNTAAKLKLTDCKIENNTVSERGSGFCLNSGNTAFTNCQIKNNRSEYYGGGFFVDFTASVSLNGCTVSGNSAKNGGGSFEMEKDGAKLVLEDTAVTGNSVDAENSGIKKGGGIHFYKGSVTLKGDVTIKDNTCAGAVNNICMRGNQVTFDASKMSANSHVAVNDDVLAVISGITEDNVAGLVMENGDHITVTDGKLTSHVPDFTGSYVNNGDGTHSRKCTGCEKLDTPEEHTFENYTCVCGAHNWDKYIDRKWDEETEKVISEEKNIPTDAKEITADTTELEGGWYVVSGTVTVEDRIVIWGEDNSPTNIVLLDGAVLNATAGIEVKVLRWLNIYGQKNDTGKIVANGGTSSAGIGGSSYDVGGTVTINGGIITASSEYGAGIGGGGDINIRGCKVEKVTINGGTVMASSTYGAGIGGANDADGGTVIVNGGTVTASSEVGAGIGGGYKCENHDTLTIADGLTVKAGYNADTAVAVTTVEYIINRNPYVTITPAHTHDFKGDYVDNGDGTHSRKCTGCDALGEPENHTYKDGVCDKCGAGIITLKNGAVSENGFIFGLAPKLTSLTDYIDVAEGYELEYSTDKIVTGTEINAVKDNISYASLTVVIFGDVNNDGVYDGMDAMIVNCLANGMLTREQVGEAVYMAADCNHDGVIDEFDVELLEEAGVLLASVDQSKSQEELQTDSAYVEYLNLIDQNPVNEETQPEQTPSVLDKLIGFIADIYALLNNLINFIKTIFV